MYFKNEVINKFKDKDIVLFVDMDGVIVDYNVEGELQFKIRRPLNSNINKLKEINNLVNVELRILSVCRTIEQIQDKNDWLDKYAPFFEKELRVILPKENSGGKSAMELKIEYLKDYLKNNPSKQVLFIDDDNKIIDNILESDLDVHIYQDSVLVD